MREPFTSHSTASGGRTVVRGVGLLVLLALGLIVASSSTSCVRTGHVGVVSVFGRVTGRTLGEGIHLVSPAARVAELSIMTQDIVSQGISEKLLEWKGIEATIELVKSQNSKVIVVGNSKTGLPLIYSGEK